MKGRLSKLRTIITNLQIDALLIHKPENRFYFSGFSGSAGVLIVTPKEAILVTDFRYVEQARSQATDFKIIDQKAPIFEELKSLIKSLKISKLGIEDEYLTFAQVEEFKKKLDQEELVPLKEALLTLRRVKEKKEIEFLTRAVEISDQAFIHILNYLKPGVMEKEIALELEFFMRRQGASKVAFDIIVASGNRSSLPHGVASDKKIAIGDLVTMDFGAVFNGYHSDITRTVAIGKINDKQKTIYNIVLEAQLAAAKTIKAGLPTKEVDAVARDIITNRGYGDFFGHGLGHGVGLEIHEKPGLSPRDNSILEAGMAVTVEPGIYLPNWGGVRIEDTVVVTENGCNTLTNSTKELLIL